ncbi:MAG: AtpZ/AtpI family protein [Phycisphaerales bacterium]
MPTPDRGRTPAEIEADMKRRMWRISGMGAELAGGIVGMGLIGWLLDRWWGTYPTATLVGAIVGILGGGLNFIRAAMALNREETRRSRRERGSHDGSQGR